MRLDWQMLPEKWLVCLHFCSGPLTCCHGGLSVSVNNLAWHSLSALTLKFYWTIQLKQNKIRQLSPFGSLKWLYFTYKSRWNYCKKSSPPLPLSACKERFQTTWLFVFWRACTVKFFICPFWKAAPALGMQQTLNKRFVRWNVSVLQKCQCTPKGRGQVVLAGSCLCFTHKWHYFYAGIYINC